MHQKVLRALEDRGPCPVTNLAYRAEMNDKQVQGAVVFLLERKFVVKTLLTDKTRLRLALQFSASSKTVISITAKGSKYLEMLDKLGAEIDWTKFDEELSWRNKRRK
jgi:predicted transcriptional regulator